MLSAQFNEFWPILTSWTTSTFMAQNTSIILKVPLCPSAVNPISTPPVPSNHWSAFSYYSFASSRRSYKWNHTECSLLYLAPSHVPKIYPSCRMRPYAHARLQSCLGLWLWCIPDTWPGCLALQTCVLPEKWGFPSPVFFSWVTRYCFQPPGESDLLLTWLIAPLFWPLTALVRNPEAIFHLPSHLGLLPVNFIPGKGRRHCKIWYLMLS